MEQTLESIASTQDKDQLSTYQSTLMRTGDWPFAQFSASQSNNKAYMARAKQEEKENKAAAESFKEKLSSLYGGKKVEFIDGQGNAFTYRLNSVDLESHFGDYKVFFDNELSSFELRDNGVDSRLAHMHISRDSTEHVYFIDNKPLRDAMNSGDLTLTEDSQALLDEMFSYRHA